MPLTLPILDDHLALLQECVRIVASPDEARPRRCGRQPTERQCLQQRIRQDVIDCYHSLHAQGQTLEQVGQLLHVAPRTLRYWELLCRPETRAILPVGRPLTRSPLEVRQRIIAFLKGTGPGIGVPTLQDQFPGVPRGELTDLLERFRAVWRARQRPEYGRVLHWQTPGLVWAADFTEPSRYGLAEVLPPIRDGLLTYPYILAVRDLASGQMLAWEPVSAPTEEQASAVLTRLFAQHGAPLVLKTDNGSAFRADDFKTFLEGAGVIPLYSPPSCPGYNGAVEAAIGSLKRRTEQQARAAGREVWTVADLRAAQAEANASHPRRLNGRTPAGVWECRPALDSVQRVVFTLTVERQRFQARQEQRIDQDEPLNHWRQSAVDRPAIERALVEHGHLLFTRKRIPLTIQTGKVAKDG